ncbi:ABC transporter ATP-binding protein [Lentisphaera profundi]|uniref:ABC transporter ATP-binding protein n=1 Tax=Lentisphaera profundi TaxID=1658616 RepID=A0ABY7VWA7_9BACT|nr:ABC transporter ATP-binding protein [Lentisphaera profundi]WDE97553.1 ABC transporter ATP-binding protein [Lentisphaera profundi]
MSNVLISCQGISKIYLKGKQEITPLNELDLNIIQGEFLALMGPSGSGKTTLLNILAGIDSPSHGKLYFKEQDISQLNRRQLTSFRAQNMAYIFQLYHLIPVLTAYENVELPLLTHKISAKQRHQRVTKALELARIDDRADHYPKQLSGGQEQRVAIARALVTDPPLIVADEPTGDLDQESAQAILTLLKSLCTELNKTVVMVTHDPKAAAFADRTLFLEKGVLIKGDDNVAH